MATHARKQAGLRKGPSRRTRRSCFASSSTKTAPLVLYESPRPKPISEKRGNKPMHSKTTLQGVTRTLRTGLLFVCPCLLALLFGCATSPVSAPCPVAMELLQDLALPAKPTSPATNGDLLDYAIDLNEQVKLDAVRKAELRKQLEKCR